MSPPAQISHAPRLSSGTSAACSLRLHPSTLRLRSLNGKGQEGTSVTLSMRQLVTKLDEATRQGLEEASKRRDVTPTTRRRLAGLALARTSPDYAGLIGGCGLVRPASSRCHARP